MEISSSVPIYKSAICRICMQNDNNSLSIFNEVYLGNKAITIAEIISECTKYPVAHNDQLPAQICHNCMEMAKNAHRFKKQTEQAYCQLKALYDVSWVPKQEQGSGSVMRVGALTTHKYTQTERTSVFLCEICPNKFFMESEIRHHRATVHALDGKKCRVCGETFNHFGQLKIHLSTEHPSEGIRCEFRCNICSREFTRKDHLKRHLIRVHKLNDMDLNITKVSLDEPEIETPPVLSSSLNNYSSHWPDYQEEDGKDLIAIDDQKNQNINATNPFSSEDEGLDQQDFNDIDVEDVKQFVENISHPEISIKDEPNDIIDAYSYDDVDIYEPKAEPETIIPEEGKGDEGGDEGEDENSKFDRQHFLGTAKMIKSDQEAIYSTSFNNQYQRNSQTNMYNCVECLLEFKLQRNLVRHMLTHTDDRPFMCHVCLKSFKRKDNLQKHLRDVHAVKQFACGICSKKFATHRQLQRHNQTTLHKKFQI